MRTTVVRSIQVKGYLKETTMTGPVLVAYATRYGSMREVAEAVAATLHERGPEFGGRVRQIRNFSCVLKNTPPGV